MKIALLSAAASIHTVRWANGLTAAGHDVTVISQHAATETFSAGVKVFFLPSRGMLGYFTMVPAVRRILRKVQPDIVSAHYASGYGTTARLANVRPWMLSVWGSDVYEFPHKSPLHKWLVRKNLLHADVIASTSRCMADQVRELVPKAGRIAITPFGVDLHAYKGILPTVPDNGAENHKVVIGTVKLMKPIYGIDTLVKAFSLLTQRLSELKHLERPELELRLVGDGAQRTDLEALASELGVSDSVRFVGQVPHQSVPNELAQLDIYVALSRSESFGVAVIEAGAAGRPVVVSSADGLAEVTVDGKTGLIVPIDDPEAAADALEKLVFDSHLRFQMGQAAQRHVAESYSWKACIKSMIAAYEAVICPTQSSSSNDSRKKSTGN